MEKKISLCMVVRDEAKHIGRCLNSVQGIVHEIIVVDTGSTDTTREIAATFGALVKSFPWNEDFSAARNASLEAATGDWILFLDADEELSLSDSGALERLTAHEEPEGYFITIINHLGTTGWSETCPDLVFRLFRPRPDYRFRGAVHEQIAGVILERNNQAKFQTADGVEITHYGYLDEVIQEKDKKKRNLSLIEKELSRAPDDRLLRYHYGVELFRAERYAEAAQELIKAANGIDPNTLYLPKLLRYIVMAHQNSGQPEAALEVAVLGLQFFPDYADLYYYAGLLYLDLKHYSRALEFLERASSMPEQPPQYASFAGVRGFRCSYHLALIAETFLNEELALKYYLAALQDNPDFTPALANILRILKPRQEPDYAKACLDKAFVLDNIKARQTLAEMCFRQNAYRLALQYWQEADALKGNEPNPTPEASESWLWKAVCLIQAERYFEALKVLSVFLPENPLYPLAKLNILLTFRLLGNTRKVRSTLAELRLLGLTEDTEKVLNLLSIGSGQADFSPEPEHANLTGSPAISAFTPQSALTGLDSLAQWTTFPSQPNIPPQVGNREGTVLGPDGVTLLLDIIQRLLALNRPNLVTALLDTIRLETLAQHGLNFAQVFLEHGFGVKAEYLLQCYLTHSPNEGGAEACFLLAEIYRETNRFSEAEGYYRHALAHDPSLPKYYLRLQDLYTTHQEELSN